MANQIPDKLIDYAVYNGGTELMGIATVDMPSIEYLSDTIKGSGVLGEMDMPTLGMPGSMEMTLNFRTITADMSSMIGNKNGVNLELRGSIQHYDSGSNRLVPVGVIVSVAGIVKSAELGSFETAAANDSKVTMELYRLKVTVNNAVKINIDKLSRVYAIGGNDLYSEVRTQLGK